MTTPDAMLYSVVVPTSVAVATNVFTTTFSVYLMFTLLENVTGNVVSLRSVLNNLSRLLVFQRIQWLFGLVYYTNLNMIARLQATF